MSDTTITRPPITSWTKRDPDARDRHAAAERAARATARARQNIARLLTEAPTNTLDHRIHRPAGEVHFDAQDMGVFVPATEAS